MSTLLDENTTVIEELDFEAACEINCGKTAALYVTCVQCTENSGLVCEPCFKAFRDRWLLSALFGPVHCKYCDFHARAFCDAYRVTPLRTKAGA